MIVVSDSSVIINLAAIDHVDVLLTLYDRVLIPPAVFEEVVLAGAGRHGAYEIAQRDWIETRSVKDLELVHFLQLELDRGEAEAIVLARETADSLLLIDERRGRSVADRLGIQKIGLLGVLVQARREEIVPELAPLLARLRDDAGFWFSDSLRASVLESVGEMP